MILTAKIIKYDDWQLLLAPDKPIQREIFQKDIKTVEIRLNDGRKIKNKQRDKIFSVISDIAKWSGHEPEEIRKLITWEFIRKQEIDWFSLSNVDMSTAREFIAYLIEFCFSWGVSTKDTLLNQTDDIGKYLYHCLEYRKCAICNHHAQVHHVDRVGMGGDREKIVHVGLSAIALCHKHHEEAHRREKELFAEYCIYGIKLDKYLCSRLRLNAKPKTMKGRVQKDE